MEPNNARSSRRTFIRLAAAAAAGISVDGYGANSSTGSTSAAGKLSDRSKRLMDQFKLKYPIFQAAPGGEDLAVAMSGTGCLAAMQLTWLSEENCQKIVRKLIDTNINFYGNFVLHFPPTNLDKALEAGLKVVQFSWGIPGEVEVKKIRSFNTRFGVQVASKEGAELILKLNPDFLICQGVEAGGHVQANDPIQNTLSEVVSIAGQVPVLASGGIATGMDIRRMLDAGASGVVMGTRLIATKESNSHQEYKDSLVKAKEDTTVLTSCFESGWPAMHRVLKNKTYKMWMAEGCPAIGKRPGENDVLGMSGQGAAIPRYSNNPPGKGTTGDIKEMIMYAGTGVKDINDVPSVKDLIPKLWKEFEG